MGTLDNNGIYIYDENDRPAPLHTLLNLGQAAQSAAIGDITGHSLIMPVADVAERNAYGDDMAAAGRPASPERPLWAETANNGVVHRNRGAGWEQVYVPHIEKYVPPNTSTAWEFSNALYLKNGHVTARIRTLRTGGPWSGSSAKFWDALPERFRPPEFLHQPVFVHNRRDAYRTALFTISPDGSGRLRGTTIGRGNWVNATITWPVGEVA